MDRLEVLTDLLEMDRMKERLKDESDKDIHSDDTSRITISSEGKD